jgi:enamine deaminase RidA (YjgF/YER057c/UK114 family)
MERRIINPWTWQDAFGFVQATEVQGAQRILFCAGQTSNDAAGNPMHPGDMRAQITLALDNLETVLRESGFTLQDVVRLNMYTTDVDLLLANYDALTTRLAAAGCRQSATLLGVTRLAFPEFMVEFEATAVK